MTAEWVNVGDEITVRTEQILLSVSEVTDGGLLVEASPREVGRELETHSESQGTTYRTTITVLAAL